MDKKNIYIILVLIIIAVAIGLALGLTKDKSSSGDGPSTVIEKWVAVGEGGGLGSIMYSPDGQTWTETTTGASFSSYGSGIAYGTTEGTSPLLVAVGEGGGLGSIMYSPDGQTWTETTTGASFGSYGSGIAYGTSNGTSPLWVAVGDDDGGGLGSIMYSPDGKVWTDSGPTGDSFSTAGFGVAYGTSNGTSPLWVAVGRDGGGGGLGSIMYSPDGKVWTDSGPTGDSFSVEGLGVAYGTSSNGDPLWVAVGDGGGGFGNIMYSADGKTWTQTTTGASFSTAGYGVAYGTSSNGDPLWVAVGDDTSDSDIMYSSDGQIWQTTTASFSSSGQDVAYGTSSNGDPLWVAVGYDGGGGLNNIMYSPDGKTWTDSGPTGDSFGTAGYGVASGTSNPAFANITPSILPWPST